MEIQRDVKEEMKERWPKEREGKQVGIKEHQEIT